ncbi:hypothetical protein FNV43_RR00748 [Rhamnella rubrinervis]|uniref:Uncharacterized protein n=1 Tax=Rhamnella rubrinervis TaxID=2594499 RepID=A0A8K0HR83_9ROSA|nr:hypothetical protein FNV43_RR00748 [Rhamnella rubrinervis]
MGIINLPPSTVQEDCMKLNRLSPTFIVKMLNPLLGGNIQQRQQPKVLNRDANLDGDRCGIGCELKLIVGSGQVIERMADGRETVTMPQKRKGEPDD